MSFIQSLQLQSFRCYPAARMEGVHPGLIVLTGPNGAGKTNVLEAVSLLTPGRGLRAAGSDDIQKKDGASAWAIAAEVETGGAAVQLGTGAGDGAKRAVRINGSTAKSQMALSDYLSCVWLTPQMDRIFIDGGSGRRRFFDKLIFTFDPGHAGRITRYENAMSQRSKLLREGRADPAWLKSLEAQMVEAGVAITAARGDFLQKLQSACDGAHAREETWFPRAQLHLSGTLDELLQNAPAVQVEEMFAYQLSHSRARDAEYGGAATGPHKTDLAVRYAVKDMAADQCSTGEQKALLIGIILAHARLMAAERGGPPVLLLDEVAAHLDENRRAALFDLLVALGGQVWMTGTDKTLFSAALDKAQFWSVEMGEIRLIGA